VLPPSPVQDDGTQQPREKSPILRDFGLFGIIVADLLGYTGAGIGIGWWLWKKVGAPWWVMLLTTSAGLVLAMRKLYLMTKTKKESP
jgi:hypothetical protein